MVRTEHDFQGQLNPANSFGRIDPEECIAPEDRTVLPLEEKIFSSKPVEPSKLALGITSTTTGDQYAPELV